MLLLLLKQPRNLWRQLGRWQRVELILLTGLIFTYLVTRIQPRLERWDAGSEAAAIFFYVYILLFWAIGPFILRHLMPRQKTLRVFYTLPLEPTGRLKLIGYFYFKYQIILFILLLPFASALLLTDWLFGLLHLIFIVVFSLLFFVWHFWLFNRFKDSLLFFPIVGLVWIVLAISVYPLIGHAPTFWLWIISAAIALFGFFLFVRHWGRGDIAELEQLWPLHEPFYTSRLHWNFSIPFLSQTANALIRKEVLGLWRNPSYRRLKLLTLGGYIAMLVYYLFTDTAGRFDHMLITAVLIIWLHYAQHFSEKYVLPEPDWFIRATPLRYFPLWLAKVCVEFFFVWILLAVQWLALWLGGADSVVRWNIVGLLLLFSLLVVSTMVNFRILFYDNPRLAGYAYHFTVVFFTVMSVNYRFVGPLVTLFMMVLIFYKTRKYFYA